jgi:hypothetical protein
VRRSGVTPNFVAKQAPYALRRRRSRRADPSARFGGRTAESGRSHRCQSSRDLRAGLTPLAWKERPRSGAAGDCIAGREHSRSRTNSNRRERGFSGHPARRFPTAPSREGSGECCGCESSRRRHNVYIASIPESDPKL